MLLRNAIAPAVSAAAAALALIALPATARAQDAQPSAAQIAVGDSIFNGAHFGACAGCHGAAGKGTSNGPKLNDKEWLHGDGSLANIKETITKGVPTPKKSKVPMPPMGGAKLSPEAIDAVSAYVYSLTHK